MSENANPSHRFGAYPLFGPLNRDIRCIFVLYAEILFCFTTLLFGLVEYQQYKEILCGYIMVVSAFLLLLLAIEMYIGISYRSHPVLVMHSIQCAFLAFVVFFSIFLSFILRDHYHFSSPDVLNSLTLIQAAGLILGMLLISFGVTSFSRSLELKKMSEDIPKEAVLALARKMKHCLGHPIELAPIVRPPKTPEAASPVPEIKGFFRALRKGENHFDFQKVRDERVKNENKKTGEATGGTAVVVAKPEDKGIEAARTETNPNRSDAMIKKGPGSEMDVEIEPTKPVIPIVDDINVAKKKENA